MAKLVTVIQTFFENGNYRNNRVEIQIPDEAAELIVKLWDEKTVHRCTTAKYLASNQTAIVKLFKDETLLGGMINVCREETEENEVYKQSFKDWEEDNDE